MIRHALIIAPKRVARSVWPDEIAAWAHTARPALRGAGRQPCRSQVRSVGLRHARDLTMIGIDLRAVAGRRAEQTTATMHPLFDLLVIDEVSKLRDPTGKRAKALACDRGSLEDDLGLERHARPSGPLDLFMPARVVTRGKLWGKSFYKWREATFLSTDWNQGMTGCRFPARKSKLNAELAPLTVTLAEDEVPQLPDLQIILDQVELPHGRPPGL